MRYIMGRQALGIDITDERLIAVQVEQQGKTNQVIDLASIAIHGMQDIGEKAEVLLRHFPGFQGTMVCGLPLSVFSLRNLSLPFRDKKRVQQTLPYEMAEQLLVGFDQQISAYLVAKRDSEGSKLIVYSLVKTLVGRILEAFAGASREPDILTVSAVSYSQQLLRRKPRPDEQLHIHADLHCISIAVAQEGRIVFSRRLPYSERMFTHSPFLQQDGRLVLTDLGEAETCLRQSCHAIERALDYFRLQFKVNLELEQAILTGPLATEPQAVAVFQKHLPVSVEPCNLLEEAGCGLDAAAEGRYIAGCHDRALALALDGLQRRVALDFRQEEFTRKRSFLATNRNLSLAAAAMVFLAIFGFGYLAYDHQRMESEYEVLHQQMIDLYRQVFPDATRINDPLAQLQSKMIELKVPEVTLPIFTEDKRILSLLTDISSRIPASTTIKISRLVIDQNGVSIKGTTDAFNNVDAIKGQLSASTMYSDVQIVSATADKDKKLVQFELKLEMGDAS